MPSDRPRLTTVAGDRDGWLLVLAGMVGAVAMVVAVGVLLLRVADALVPSTRIAALEDVAHDEVPAPTTAPTPEPGEPTPTEPPLTGVRNVLVVGIDSREGLTDEQLLALGTEDNGSRLTDTVIWVQYDAGQDIARLVSFPRDLAVRPDGGPRTKLNALHYLGGPDLLVSTVEDLVGADLDHYVEVNLAGFIELAETLDGVEVCLEDPMVDRDAGVDLPAGCQELTATQAAGFVRARQVVDEFGAGTAGRAARQQYYIRQAVAQALSSETLTSPSRVRSLVGMVRRSVVVDQAFGTTELLRFADAFRSFDADRIVGATVPFTSERLDDGLFYDMLTEGAEDLFAAMRDGSDLPAELVSEAASGTPASSSTPPAG